MNKIFTLTIVFLLITMVFVNATNTETPLLYENFEDDSLDSRISIQKIGSFNSNPNIKLIESFGSQKAYGFGRSTCAASCFDSFVTRMIITFSSPVFIDSLNFNEIELFGNWGSGGQIYINGTYLQNSYFGRSPSNDRVADKEFRKRNYIIDTTVISVEIRVRDITNSSEIFIDDLKIFGDDYVNTSTLDSGLVAYYPFNGNANDESGNRHDGIVNGATLTSDRFGHENSAYHFDGNDFISVADDSSFTLGTNPFSFSLWINLDQIGSYYMMGHDEGGGTTRKWIFWFTGNSLGLHERLNGGYWVINVPWNPEINRWYYINLVRNQDTFSVYVDGQLIGSNEDSRSIPDPSASLLIGNAELSSNMFRGKIDDVRIYNRALSKEEIDSLYKQKPNQNIDEPPSQPKDLTAEVEVNQTTLTWTPNTESDVQYYRIYRDLYFPPTTLIDSVSAGVNLYIDTLNSEGQTWFYAITAVDNDFNESSFSEGASSFVQKFPDLKVDLVEAPPQILSGETFDLTWQVSNVGTEGTQVPEWFDKVYLSTSPEFDPNSSTVLGTFENFSYLAANEAYQNTAQFTLPKDIFGTHYIHVVTDVKKQLNESDEGNNTGSSNSITINLSPFPDLEVTSILTQDIAFSGDSTNISWTVTNNGTAPTEVDKWTDRIFFSKDSVFDFIFTLIPNTIRIDETALGIIDHTGILQPGSSYTTNLSVRIPHATLTGDYYLFVYTDVNNGRFVNERGNVYEFNQEFNNWTFKPIHIVLSDLPDLVVTDIKAPVNASLGQDIEIEWVVQNQGLNDTYESGWSDQIYISSSSTFSAEEAKVLGTFSHSGVLERDSLYSKNVTVRIPEGFSGPNYIYIKTDYNNQVFEHDFENNNVTKNDVTIEINNPDFAVAEIIAPNTAGSGKTIDVSWKIRNQGEGSLYNGSWSDKIFLSKSDVFNTELVTELGTWSRSGNFLKDSVYTAQKSVILPNGIEGPYYIFIQTDFKNQVFEEDFEENNIDHTDSPIQINLSPWADLVVSSLEVPEESQAGERIAVSWNVKNEGEASVSGSSWTDKIYLSTNEIFNQDAQLLKSVEVSRTLNPSSGYSQSEFVTLSTELAGKYYIFVVTDANDSIYEHSGEGNNTSPESEITIEPYPPIDLTALSISVPDSGSSWNPINVQWSVQNIGAGKTMISNWTDAFYLSLDKQLNRDEDILVKRFSHSGALEPGESYSRNENVKLPDIAGNYYAIIETDTEFNTDDVDNENNYIVSTHPVHITLSPQADLQITSLNAPPTATAGQPVTVEFKVENKGDGNTNTTQWYDGFYLSTDPNLDNSDIHLANYARNGALVPGEFYTDSLEMEIPVYASGSYFLIVKTDNKDDVYERNFENNNTRVIPISITVPPPADLIVTGIVVPESASPGEEITVSWTVENIGENAAVGRMRDAVYISADENWQVEDALLGVVTREINIPPGGNLKFAQKFSLVNTFKADAEGNITEQLPGVLPEEYHAIVRTDIRNNIRESNITNNTDFSDDLMDVDVEILQLGISKNDSLRAEERRYYRIQVDENLDLKLTFQSDDSLNSSEIYVAYGRIPTTTNYDFKASDPFSASQELIVPSTQDGTYYLMINSRNIGIDKIEYSLFAEVLSFSISSITPDYGGSGGIVTTTLKGAGFSDSTSIFLKISDDFKLKANLLEVVNSMEAKVRFNLKGIEIGIYDIIVTNKDYSTDTLIKGFEVEKMKDFDINYDFSVPDLIRFGSTVPYSFNLTNRSNTDVPYLIFKAIIPVDIIINANWSKNFVNLQALGFNDFCKDCKYYNKIVDPSNGLEYFVIILVGNNIAPNETLQLNLQLKPTKFSDIDIATFYSIEETNSFIENCLHLIETSRLNILTFSNIPNDTIQTIALDSVRYNKLIIKSLIDAGILFDCDIKDYLNLTLDHTILGELKSANIVKESKSGYRNCQEKCEKVTNLLCAAGTPWDILACMTLCAAIPEPTAYAICVFACTFGRGFLCSQSTKFACHIVCSKMFRPVDPNEIVGPPSYGDENWISNKSTLPYTIYFENDSMLATASAQLIKITQKLDSTIDSRTFRLGSFGFGNYIFNVPENSAFYTQRLDLRDSLGLFVDVSAGIDITKNEIFWQFKSIDPATGELPVFDGFLAINDTLGRGQGFVNYTINPRVDSQTGEIVNAQAEIVFDNNAPMLTNTWFNTIDADPPVSQILPLNQTQDSENFILQWSGTDIGSGITEYSIYASSNNEPFKLWTQNTPYNSDIFNSPFNGEYAFYSIAKDGAGNVEATPETFDAKTSVVTGIEDNELHVANNNILLRSYPNPFSSHTRINFELPVSSNVRIAIYDINGREVKILVNSKFLPGTYSALWDGKNNSGGKIPSGIYFLQMHAGDFVGHDKIIYTR